MATEPHLLGHHPAAAETALLRYLPAGLLERLQQERDTPRRARVERFHGAVLLTDLADFSRLTDRYSARGPEGVEQLSAALDSYFGRMTEIVLDHGGDVADLVGDAIVAVWPRGNGGLGDCTMRAVSCGLALQAALPQVMQDTGLELRQRVSVAAGELAQFIVGGSGSRWRGLTAGEPLRQASACNHLAQPGEVLVCDSAWLRVWERCHGRLLDGGHAIALDLPDPPPPRRRPAAPRGLPPQWAEQFLPRPLLQRSGHGPGRWPGEFRNVCAVFVGLPMLDPAGPGALEQVQRAVEGAQREFGRCGGDLENLWMDDKGLVALAVFGLPGQTHGDDAARAVRAALALSAQLADWGMPCTIGIASGRSFYGDSGGPRRRHIALVGDVMNRAARLMQGAADGVWCDEATRSLAARAFGFAAGPLLQAKGAGSPVPVFVPSAAGSADPSNADAAIIGREFERQRIARQLDALLGGHGGLLLLRGEAGIGKSRLLDEAALLARRRSIRVLSTQGSAIETATPLFPWRRILWQLLLGDAPFDAAAARWKLQQGLGGDALLRDWLPLLNDILPLQYADNAVTRHMEPGARASAIRSLLLRLLEQQAARQPSLLLADDLHWFDDASAAILAAAADGVAGLLVLGGTRPPEPAAPAGLIALLRHRRAASLSLEQLPRPALEQLACRRLQVRELPQALADFLYGRCGGNPFYAEELLLGLSSAGLIAVEQEACRLSHRFDHAGPATLPTTLQGVIVSRIDKLPLAAQLTLKLISVIGREFSLAMLRDLHPAAGEAAAFEPILHALLAADLLRPSADRAAEYRLKHAILHEAVYDLLPYAQRRQFHREVALWIEAHEAHHLQPFYAELALHWERTGDPLRAIAYLEKAAALAFERYASRQAIRHIRRAYALAQEHGLQLNARRIETFEAILGDSHQELFEYHLAALHFRRCLAQLRLPVPQTRVGLAAALLKELLLQLRMRLTGRAPAIGNRPAAQRAAHIYQRLAESSFFDNRMLELLHQMLCSVNLAERSGSTRETVDGFGALAVVAVAAGLPGAGRYYNRRSTQIAAGAEHPGDAAYGYLVDMVYRATVGDWPALHRSEIKAEAIYRQLGGMVRWQQSQSITYTALILRGCLAQARPVLQRARAAMTAETPVQVLSFYYCSMLDLALAADEPLAPLLQALQLAQGPGLHRSDRMRSLGLIAKAWLRLGDREQALAMADAALDIMRQGMPTPYHIADGMAAAAEVYMDLWEEDGRDASLQGKAGEICRALLQFARRVPVGEPVAALQQARYRFLAGRRRAAARWWRQAAAAAQRFGAAHDQAMVLYRMGRHLGAAEGGGAAALRRAEQAFDAIGAAYDAGQARHARAAALL